MRFSPFSRVMERDCWSPLQEIGVLLCYTPRLVCRGEQGDLFGWIIYRKHCRVGKIIEISLEVQKPYTIHTCGGIRTQLPK